MPYLGSKPADKALEADDIAANAVTTAKIADDAVDRDKINLVSTSSVPSLEAKGDGSSQDGYIQLNCSQNSHGIKLKSPPHSAAQSYTLTYPSSIVNNGFMKTDSSGNLSFSASVGKVVQFSNTFVTTDASTTNTFPDDDTIPQSDEGAEYTTVAFTPTEAGNKIVVHINAQAATSNAAIVVVIALFKNSDADAVKVAFEETHGNGPIVMNLIHEDTAADTSEITSKLRYGSSGNTGTVYMGSQHHSGGRFGNTAGISIHITEYDA